MSGYLRWLAAFMVIAALGGCAPSGNEPLGTPVDMTVLPPTDLAASDTPSAIEAPSPIPATDVPIRVTPTQRACSIPVPQPSAGTVRYAFIGDDGNLYVRDNARARQQLTDSGD